MPPPPPLGASSKSTSSARPPPTSTPASSSSRPSCRRPRAASSSGRSCGRTDRHRAAPVIRQAVHRASREGRGSGPDPPATARSGGLRYGLRRGARELVFGELPFGLLGLLRDRSRGRAQDQERRED